MSTNQALNATYQDLGNGFQFYNTAHILKDGQSEVEARCEKAAADANNREQSTHYDNAPRDPHPDDELDVLAVREVGTGCADPKSRPYHDAEVLVASAAAQTYSYMLTVGLAYGCIITGEAIVFLHVEEDDPRTLLYHLALPIRDVANKATHLPDCAFTAVAQLMTFAIMAFRGELQNPDWTLSVQQMKVGTMNTILTQTRIQDSTASQSPDTHLNRLTVDATIETQMGV
ncbi:MAG: hypothetical protein Q9176_006140 [Flavoplaca citrina]